MCTKDDKLISAIKTYFISDCGRVSSTRFIIDCATFRVIGKGPAATTPKMNPPAAKDHRFHPPHHDEEELTVDLVKLVKFENVHDLESASVKRLVKLSIPNMIRCQNCETNYPTKYQYQRHQCEFNAEKVVLKPNADFVEMDKVKKVKYDCGICGKQFVSRNNLERHQSSHESSKDNTCEHCHKQFVSENRLRIHKENHCKKAGDISKFYRSDVTVWKCKKCQEVFSSSLTAAYHVENCMNFIDISDIVIKKEPIAQEESEAQDCNNNTNNGCGNVALYKTIEKISTELLLQCEFCNRTYSDKQVLLKHQKVHKTDRNYECVVCGEVFTSYIIASQHWLRKCSEKANLFYLPKLTYCEFCDRTFKSHEILYIHKIKKKHYTPKLVQESPGNELESSRKKDEGGAKNEDTIDKLIEDVLIALEIPLNKQRKRTPDSNKQVVIKIEPPCEEVADLEDDEEENVADNPNDVEGDEDQPPVVEKKKRGRKRKLKLSGNGKNNCGLGSGSAARKQCVFLEQGYKYQCERCVNVFDGVADLENHREKEHAANFNCDECGQILHSARALLIHSRAHKSLKPYVCDTCGRSYSQTSHLWQHMRFHQGIKPFACPHEGCEARYTIRPDLKDHIRKVHTRERPFKCNVCGKCFLTGSVYYQHRLIHTEDRRYGCDMCEKRFFRADALNNHKRIHTNERPYPCFVCGRLFRQKGDRNKHFRTQHPDAIISSVS